MDTPIEQWLEKLKKTPEFEADTRLQAPEQGYFERMQLRVMNRIETENIAPLLASLPMHTAHNNPENLPEGYFSALQDNVWSNIEAEAELRANAPTLALMDKTILTNTAPSHYFEQLEDAVFARVQTTPTTALTVTKTKTNRKIAWSLAGSAAAAAVIGLLWFNIENTTSTPVAEQQQPLSSETQALFAQVSQNDAVVFLKDNAETIDESLLENHTDNLEADTFISLPTDEISDFVEDNQILLED